MAERRIEIGALVNAADPERNVRWTVAYVFGGGRVVKKEPPTQPGQPYHWRPELIEDEE